MCRQQVADLAGYQNDFSQQGAQLAIIGNGRAMDLPEFRQLTGYKGLLFTDPSRDSYKYLKFKSGLTDIIGMTSFTQTFSAFKAGFKPGSLQGNALQQGGAIVVTPEGKITYFFISSTAGDHPPIKELLAAAE